MANDTNPYHLKTLLQHASTFDIACILLSNQFEDRFGVYEVVAGFGAKEYGDYLFAKENSKEFLLGFMAYDLKNSLHGLHSANKGCVEVPDSYFFKPEQCFRQRRNGKIEFDSLELFIQSEGEIAWKNTAEQVLLGRTNKDEYLQNIVQIKEQIKEGDFYEMNYCTEWSGNVSAGWNPYITFENLNTIAPSPFAAFFKYGNKFLLCSSPERFLAKRENTLISQPIKGTRKRGINEAEDAKIKLELVQSEKDRAENIMITDLVRNDLSICCLPGSVQVEELCKIYGFSHVFQMISTIIGELQLDVTLDEIIKALFPMGSMTGAPKRKVMEEIDKIENFKRGWYSGSVGYVYNQDFDLNVVIRSLQFDQSNARLAYHVGGAIVFESDGEQEYEECAVKAAGMRRVL